MYIVHECSAAEFLAAAGDLVESVTLGECDSCEESAVLHPETDLCAECHEAGADFDHECSDCGAGAQPDDVGTVCRVCCRGIIE